MTFEMNLLKVQLILPEQKVALDTFAYFPYVYIQGNQLPLM